MAEDVEGDVTLHAQSGAGRVIALYLDLAREVDFWRSAEDDEREYAALDRASTDEIGMADAWFLRSGGAVQRCALDWELSPIDAQYRSMERTSAERAFHDAPALFTAVWVDRLARLREEVP